MLSLLKLSKESVYKISDATTENDMQYQLGKAMAFTELLYLRDHNYRDYMRMLKEITNVVESRRALGFASKQNTAPACDAS